MMKFVVLLALIAIAVAQNHRPGFDHGDPLHHLMFNEVASILKSNQGISVDDCATKCDALFDLAAGHDEEMTDKLCRDECDHQINHGNHHVRPTGHN